MKKICKNCKDELDGVMIFYPDLCLKCVIEKDIENVKNNRP